jgi:tRNA (mo5U34)-methyltransferase
VGALERLFKIRRVWGDLQGGIMVEQDLRALQAKIDAVNWYHEFDFGNGLKATTRSDTSSHRRIWEFLEANLDSVDFRGKSVLDIGAWDGYWSFYAERRGAKSVLSTDDLSQNWSEGTGIQLAKELLNSKIEINQQMSVYRLASMGRKFDVILFLGVYYHLHDPFYALSQIRHCCHENTVVLIDGPVSNSDLNGGAVFELRNRKEEFLPTPSALDQLLQAAYINTNRNASLLEREKSLLPTPPPPPPLGRLGWRWRLRMCWQALLGSRIGVNRLRDEITPLPVEMTAVESFKLGDRIFLECRPFAGINEIHDYPPPFDLGKYDPRFAELQIKRAA